LSCKGKKQKNKKKLKKKQKKMEVGQFLPVVPPGLAEGWQQLIQTHAK